MTFSPAQSYPSKEDFIKLLQLTFSKEKGMSRSVGTSLTELNGTKSDGHIRYEIEYKSHGKTVTAYVLFPDHLAPRVSSNKKLTKAPAVLVSHTHGSNWGFGANESVGVVGDKADAIALDLVHRGYIVLAPDYEGFSKRLRQSKQEDSESTTKGMIGFNNILAGYNLNGDSYLRHVIQDVMAGIDVLESYPEVRKSRIGLVGYSFGGHISSKAAVFDERVRATVAMGAVSNIRTKIALNRKIDPTENVHGLLQLGDTQDLLRLIAPRALLISSSKNDLYAPEPEKVYESIKTFWESMGAGQKLTFLNDYEDSHTLSDQMKKDAYEWLDKQLMG
jgi:dienelactone hydrolase